MGRRVPCVGAVVRDADGRMLLVRRGRAPAAGSWSVPGGRVEPGESAGDAVRREVLEETGLEVEVGGLVGTVERAGLAGDVYVIADYDAVVVAGRLAAGDDAAEAAWFGPSDVLALTTAPGLVASLQEWGRLPR